MYYKKEICKYADKSINLVLNSVTCSNDNSVSFEIVGNIDNKSIYQKFDSYTSGIIEYNKLISKI